MLSAIGMNRIACNARSVRRANPGLPLQRAEGSHDHIRTALHRPPRIQGSVGVLSDAVSVDRWSPSEIHKHIVARGLLCDQPSCICGAACTSTFAYAKADRRNTTNRQGLLRAGLPRRKERRSERKFGSWRRVFLLGNSSESRPVGQMPVIIEGRDHGETSSVSNCRSQRRLRRVE
jgi:hypothetical protein